MEDEIGDHLACRNESNTADFKPARFVAELDLPAADSSLLNDASKAVRQEFRDCSKWKRLRCRKVSIFAERDRGTVYVVHVGASVEFDWTWEGAKAFRPKSLDDDERFANHCYEQAEYEDEILWSGEIVEVDERNGCLFISLDNPELAPTVGSFFVRPFEFLSVLDAVFIQPEVSRRYSVKEALILSIGKGHHEPWDESEQVKESLARSASMDWNKKNSLLEAARFL